MALAYLYSKIRKANGSLPKAHGFIVDHRARPESTEEAQWVAEELRWKCKLGSKTSFSDSLLTTRR
jgi:tRNA(Ile)-lysidine synthase